MLTQTTTGMNLDNMMLNGRSQTQMVTQCIVSFIHSVQHRYISRGRKISGCQELGGEADGDE